MILYTSYFAKIKLLENNNIIPINIALYKPKWVTLKYSIKLLAPTDKILRIGKSGDKEEYTKLFNEYLNNLDFNKIYNSLTELSKQNNKDIALCCYEKPTDFCHRHLVASWLNNNLNINIKEYSI